MPSSSYVAPPDTEVGYVTPQGAAKSLTFSKTGTFTTSNEAEIAALDAVATAESSSIGFAPKKES